MGCVKKRAYQQSNNKCSICGGTGPKWPVEAHEVWNYNEDEKIQTLVNIVALCPPCHQTKHIGLAIKRNKFKEVITHFKAINGISENKAMEYIEDAFKTFEKRSEYKWKTDLSLLREINIPYHNR
ncbi:MAG: HNH endonuclease [Sedimenticola sp.]